MHFASVVLLPLSTLVPLCNSVLFRICSATARLTKRQRMTISNDRAPWLSLAALETEHLSQLTLNVCSLAVSAGHFKTYYYYYFSAKELCDWMHFQNSKFP